MNLILDILFPKRCVGCKQYGSYFCQDCVRSILQTDLVCPRCERLSVSGQTHPVCIRRFGLDGLWSLGIYQNPLKMGIKQLKYGRVTVLGETLADILIEYWARYQPFILEKIKKDRGESWAIIPVPLHWWKGNSRGFNQASLIGQILSKKLGLAYSEGLNRVRHTKPQVELKGWDRHQNIKGAFEISESFKTQNIKSVILLDDVWTTGSTLKECCYVLKRAGAKKVWAITLAR